MKWRFAWVYRLGLAALFFAALWAMNLQIKERFDAEKIAFAFPTQTLCVKQESQQLGSPLAAGHG